jgi:sugar phosphate isomerase/epimerase
MTLPLAVQLYSVRDQIATDYASTLRALAEMGYAGVEVVGLPAHIHVPDMLALVRDLGFEVVASHAPLPLGADQQRALDWVALLGCSYAVCAWLDPAVYFASLDGVKRACDLLNEANVVYRQHGYTLAYHNHWFELYPIEGRPALHHMLDLLDPSIVIELDTYWTQTGGVDPLATLALLGSRAPLLHIKDGPCKIEAAMLPIGSGVMDFKTLIPTVQTTAQWLIVELDRTDGDMLSALRQSYDYLTAAGLGQGRGNHGK